MEAAAPRAYHFDGFRVDLVRRQVYAADGAALALSSRAYDTLVNLIERRGEIVSKDDLMKAVWPRAVVEENNLSQAISSLRRALGDPRDSPRYIATIAGRGYRFVADVTVDGASEAERTPILATPVESAPATMSDDASGAPRGVTRRWMLAGAAGGVATGAPRLLPRPTKGPTQPTRSIAVLPFQPLLDTIANDALELGMADTLISRLSELPGVVVAPLSSVRAYNRRDQDPLAAGRDLGVSAVLESHIQMQPDRVRLTARLLDVGSGSALWSARFDERSSDFFALQDALAQQVVDALQVELSADTRQRLRRHETDNLEAWQLYLQARFNWATRNAVGLHRAIELYNAALALDPKFALAAAGLADSWAVMGVFNMLPPAEAFTHARAAAERAVALDPQLAEGQAALGHVMVQADRNWRGGESQYRLALKRKPTYGQALFWLANNLCYQGRVAEALSQAELSQSVEPMSVPFAANVGMIQYMARDFDAAYERLAGIVEAAPQYPVARRVLVRVLLIRGRVREARELLNGHETEYAPGGFADVGRALALDGQLDAAHREMARIEKLGEQGFGVGYDLAQIHCALGEHADALGALERGVIDGSQTIGFLNVEPALDSIRDMPRFRAVSRQLGLG
jgi:DNA-binding winged helix-turn-helix (wHTH) protein/TolB-like protein